MNPLTVIEKFMGRGFVVTAVDPERGHIFFKNYSGERLACETSKHVHYQPGMDVDEYLNAFEKWDEEMVEKEIGRLLDIWINYIKRQREKDIISDSQWDEDIQSLLDKVESSTTLSHELKLKWSNKITAEFDLAKNHKKN